MLGSLPVVDGPDPRPSLKRLVADSAIAHRSPRVVKMELILTEACNLGCTYCFEYQANHQASMDYSTAQRAVDFLIDASRDSEWVGITFMGGEPLLQFDLLAQVVAYAKTAAQHARKSVTFGLQTNGVLIREPHAKFFRDEGVRYCLSLDGGRVSHDRHRKTLGGSGTFQVVAAKMKMLKRYQHWQGSRMTVTPQDAHCLGENIRTLHEQLAINQFVIGFATHVEWSDEQIASYATGLKDAFDYFADQRLFKRSKRLRIGLFELGQLNEAFIERRKSQWGCGAGSGRLAVSPDGTLNGCSKLAWGVRDGSSNPPLPLGSVDSGFSRPENRLKLLNHTSDPRLKCQTCDIAAFCNGGCYAANIADTGDMYVPADYFCKLMFAQKHACEYARSRIKGFGLDSLYWGSDLPDITDLQERAERVYEETG